MLLQQGSEPSLASEVEEAGLITCTVNQFSTSPSCTLHAGYALVTFIPVSFICIIPNGKVVWACVMGGTALSAGFLVLNLKNPVIANFQGSMSGVILTATILAHVTMGLIMKIKLFTYNEQ